MAKMVTILYYKDKVQAIYKDRKVAEKFLMLHDEKYSIETYELEPCDCGLGYKNCKGDCIEDELKELFIQKNFDRTKKEREVSKG